MIIFFAIILTLGIWSAGTSGPHHPSHVDDAPRDVKRIYSNG